MCHWANQCHEVDGQLALGLEPVFVEPNSLGGQRVAAMEKGTQGRPANRGQIDDPASMLVRFDVGSASDGQITQRDACGCVVSGDIGMYDACLHGCQYCYATKSFNQAKVDFDEHNPNSPSLLGWHERPKTAGS